METENRRFREEEAGKEAGKMRCREEEVQGRGWEEEAERR